MGMSQDIREDTIKVAQGDKEALYRLRAQYLQDEFFAQLRKGVPFGKSSPISKEEWRTAHHNLSAAILKMVSYFPESTCPYYENSEPIPKEIPIGG